MAQDGKTEKPTARRLREARKDGQFPRSQDPATWLAIAAGAALVPHAVGVLRDEVAAHARRAARGRRRPDPGRRSRWSARLPTAVLRAAGAGRARAAAARRRPRHGRAGRAPDDARR